MITAGAKRVRTTNTILDQLSFNEKAHLDLEQFDGIKLPKAITTEKPKRGRPKSTEPKPPKPKKDPKITLEEFWKEYEEDGVRPSQISKKLMDGLSFEERKRLNPQDLEDLKEIQSL